jgi:hypothetical protein
MCKLRETMNLANLSTSLGTNTSDHSKQQTYSTNIFSSRESEHVNTRCIWRNNWHKVGLTFPTSMRRTYCTKETRSNHWIRDAPVYTQQLYSRSEADDEHPDDLSTYSDLLLIMHLQQHFNVSFQGNTFTTLPSILNWHEGATFSNRILVAGF